MIQPINGFILIEPVKHDSFVAQERETYQEIGIVIEVPRGMDSIYIQKGDKVFFDAWMVSKYAKNDKEDYWLVKFDDIRAVERNE